MRGLRIAAALGAAHLIVTLAADASAAGSLVDVRGAARKAIVQGDLTSAKRSLEVANGPEVASAERAAMAELLYVIDVWSATGRPPASIAANDAPMPDPEEDWERAFKNARDRLAAGQYVEAARRFDTLVGAAPDLVAAARAAELRALAREASSGAPVAPPVAQVGTVSPPSEARRSRDDPAASTRWYGWQTIPLDVLAFSLVVPVPAAGIPLYLIDGPVVHLAHGRGLTALASFGLRIAGPLAGAGTGIAINSGFADGGSTGNVVFGIVGAGIGMVGAAVLDAAWLAHERREPDE